MGSRYHNWNLEQMRGSGATQGDSGDSAGDQDRFWWMPINTRTQRADGSPPASHEEPAAKGTTRRNSNSAAPKPRARSKLIEKDASNVARKRSGSILGRVSKRARQSGSEIPKVTDDTVCNAYETSIKKFEAFRYNGEEYGYSAIEDVAMAPRKTLRDNQATMNSGMSHKALPSSDPQPWLFDDSDIDNTFDFIDSGNCGTKELPIASDQTQRQSKIHSDEGIFSISEQSSLPGPNAEVVIREKEPQYAPHSDPFDDLEDADFSILDGSGLNPSQPNAAVEAKSHKPIVRAPFPQAVRDRSRVIGVSAATILRTCFRIGEALRAGSSAVHSNNDVFIELYARVSWSAREETRSRQHFKFIDLFHDRPPYLKGVYDLWKGNELWDAESRPFLDNEGPPKLCRCIGKTRRDCKELVLTVFNLREASWDDVDHVKAIICGVKGIAFAGGKFATI